jgi:hypothetical protein
MTDLHQLCESFARFPRPIGHVLPFILHHVDDDLLAKFVGQARGIELKHDDMKEMKKGRRRWLVRRLGR